MRINSGRFGVAWEQTKAVFESGRMDVTVVRPEGQDGEEVEGNGEEKGVGREV